MTWGKFLPIGRFASAQDAAAVCEVMNAVGELLDEVERLRANENVEIKIAVMFSEKEDEDETDEFDNERFRSQRRNANRLQMGAGCHGQGRL